MTQMKISGYPLPIQQNNGAALIAEGFVTPQLDKRVQVARFLPKAVLPIVFLPGIMGSNLRMSAKRQHEMGRKDNIAWRPDNLGLTNVHRASTETPAERQLRLDRDKRQLIYTIPTGDPISVAMSATAMSNSTAASAPQCY